MACDQASWFWPVGVWYSAVAVGVSPELDWDGGWLDGAMVGASVGCVTVFDGVGFGDGLWLGSLAAGIFAVAKPSGLALACSSELLTADDGTAASVAASSGAAELEVSGDGTAPTATATPRPARAAATPAPTARRPRCWLC
jgi:hypothetical protein